MIYAGIAHRIGRAVRPDARAQGRVTLFYDAGCGVCSWLALRAVRGARARAVSAVPIDSPEAELPLGALSHEARWSSWHLLEEDGRLHSGGAAAPVLLRRLRYTRALVAPLEASPSLTERLYRLGARTRSLWGRLVPRRSVAQARRELAVLTGHNQSERGASCSTIL